MTIAAFVLDKAFANFILKSWASKPRNSSLGSVKASAEPRAGGVRQRSTGNSSHHRKG